MDTGTVIAILALAVTVIGGGTAWVLRFGRIEAAAEVAREARAETEKLAKELAEFKVDVARNYATAAMVAAVESSVVAAINRLGDRMDRIFERAPATRTTRAKV